MITASHARPFKQPLIQEYEALGLDRNKIGSLYVFDPAGQVMDLSGNDRNATIGGAVFAGKGRYGNSITFDGVDDYVENGNYTTTGNSGKEVSAFVWVKKTSGGSATLISHANNANKGQWYLDYGTGAAGSSPQIITVIAANPDYTAYKEYRATASYLAPLSVWHHIGFTFDNGTLKLYLDSIEVGLTKVNDDVLTTLTNPNLSVLLGANRNAADAKITFLSGTIDISLIYSGVLNNEQIRNLYNEGL